MSCMLPSIATDELQDSSSETSVSFIWYCNLSYTKMLMLQKSYFLEIIHNSRFSYKHYIVHDISVKFSWSIAIFLS